MATRLFGCDIFDTGVVSPDPFCTWCTYFDIARDLDGSTTSLKPIVGP